MTHTTSPAGFVPRCVGAAAEVALSARGDVRALNLVFERSPVPMLMFDGQRRFVDGNRPARLMLRLSLDELRTYAIDDLTPPHLVGAMEWAWARLLDAGLVAAPFQVAGLDGSRLDVIYYALANVLPGLHLVAFAPANWPGEELGLIEADCCDLSASMTAREIQVLGLAANGFSGPELAQELRLATSTVNTHFKNIYEKLNVRSRAAAVAKAMRLGVIN
jgi:DNA-binding CsgD family transcriptional regulator